MIRKRNPLIVRKILYLWCCCHMDRVKRIWYLSPMRAAKVQASLRIRAVSPEPPLLAHTSSESRGFFRQKARSLAPLNGWACAVKICHDGMLKDTNSLDGAHMVRSVTKNDRTLIFFYFWFSYMPYIVGIGIVKCWSWSLCNDLGSTFSILTINFHRKNYKPKSLIWYDVVLLLTLHNNYVAVLVECLQFVSKSKDFRNSQWFWSILM